MDLACVNHLRHLMSPKDLRKTIRLAEKSLEPIKDQFDAIAVRGVSGLISGPMIALALNKSLIVVRKKGELRHSTNLVEGDQAAKRYVIVDDFIYSGQTAIDIVEAVYRWSQAECIGLLETYEMVHINEPKRLTMCKNHFDLLELMKRLQYGDETTNLNTPDLIL